METSLHFGLLFNIDRTDTMTIYARARYIFDNIWSLVPGNKASVTKYEYKQFSERTLVGFF